MAAGPQASREAGFTLIEILVAFTIALLALGVLYRVSSSGLAAGATAGRYNRALLVAQSALAEIGVAAPLHPGEGTQQVTGGFDEVSSVRPRPDLLPGPGAVPGAYPYEVSVAVSWRDGDRTRSINLSTIRLGPLP